MGCFASKEEKISKSKAKKDTGFKRPQWRADGQWDEKELKRKREEFWETQPAYGGAQEIWDTLKAVTSDLSNPSNTLILESAGIIVHGNDLRTSYDERGFKYDLPNFILSEPSNLVKRKPEEVAASENDTPLSQPHNS